MSNGKFYDLLIKEDQAIKLALAEAKTEIENHEEVRKESQAALKSGLTTEELESFGLHEFVNSPPTAAPDLWSLEAVIGRSIPFHPEFEDGFKGLFKGFTLTNVVSQLSRSVGSWEYKYPTLFSVKDGGGQYLIDILTESAHNGTVAESPTTRRAIEWLSQQIEAAPDYTPTTASTLDIGTSGQADNTFYSVLAGNFTPERLNKLLGMEGLNLFDFATGQITLGTTADSWCAVFWVLKNEGLIKPIGSRLAEQLIRNTFEGAPISKSSINCHPFAYRTDEERPDTKQPSYKNISRHLT